MRWVVMWTADEEAELKFSRWQLNPHFAGGNEELPTLTAQEWDQITVHFQAEAVTAQAKNLNIPLSWLPSSSELRDSVFLAAAGLDHGLDQAVAMSKLPPQEKGVINTKEWLTQMVDQKLRGLGGGAPAKVNYLTFTEVGLIGSSFSLWCLCLFLQKGEKGPAGSKRKADEGDASAAGKRPKHPPPEGSAKRGDARGGAGPSRRAVSPMPVEILDGEDDHPTAQAAQAPEAPRPPPRGGDDPAFGRQAALDEEVRNIPPPRQFSSRDNAKIISSVIKAVPKEYVDQFPPAADA
ncbi:hypothetical protein SOVF_104990 [Spinacia oleracea]|nr:hypothetical protein SOVF_104990 [Spinacia oleracea]